ncbi:MAG: 2'-5' RNA ligase family protein [Pseudomonadota bacterium]
MIYGLAYPAFDAESAARIHAFRARHEPKRARLVPPHVTLVFSVANAHPPAILALVEKVAGTSGAFPMIFDRCVIEYDPFEATRKHALLCGEGGAHIRALHERLYAGPHRSELSADHPFKPHMTIASHTDRADAERVDLRALGALPIRADITALHVVGLEAGRLSELKTAPLLN